MGVYVIFCDCIIQQGYRVLEIKIEMYVISIVYTQMVYQAL